MIAPLLGFVVASASSVAGQPSFPAGVQEVRVFVRAVRDGAPALDLRPDEFEVREDGNVVSGVRVLALGRAARENERSAFDLSTLIPGVAIVIDDFLTTGTHVAYVREHVRDFVRELQGERFVALVAPSSGVTAVGRAPMGLQPIFEALERIPPSAEFSRVFFPASDRPSASRAELLALAERVREARIAAVSTAAESLAAVRGERVVLVVAPRAMSYAGGTARVTYDEMLRAVRRANARLFALEYRPATTLPALPSIETQTVSVESRPDASPRALNRRRRSFETAPGAGGALDLTHALATDTGGYSTRGGLRSSLAAVARELESHYLIAYERTAPPDGRFHTIEIRVKRKDVRLRHRSGYFAR